ncbi:MAG: hypothetical protein HC789_22940 [Microcoleus sp. CSU_2_2]|nr:hypothetical protein [Microcoleus sp. SU_5_3]NJS13018.1 hypothetical protein [Microcoleus sp. CSU_2_2]
MSKVGHGNAVSLPQNNRFPCFGYNHYRLIVGHGNAVSQPQNNRSLRGFGVIAFPRM